MIRVVYQINREIMRFTIVRNKKTDILEVFYSDRLWETPIRCIPKDEQFIRTIKFSRNKIPQQLAVLFELTDSEKAEYEACNTEDDVGKVIVKDARKHGATIMDYIIIEDKDDS